jgi:hypothetical protein
MQSGLHRKTGGGVVRMALTLAAATAAACGVVLAPAGAASADQSAQETIGQLESQGYQVNIDRVGSGPLNTCVVTSVRNPYTNTQWIRVGGGRNQEGVLVPFVVSRTVQVSLYCGA